MKIGNQIRHRRTELNLSRGELANKIQVTPSAIANYENGISYPKPDILVALMNALEVDANYLYRDYLSPRTIQRLYRNVLRPEEKESILKYRELSESRKSLVRLIIDEEYKRNISIFRFTAPAFVKHTPVFFFRTPIKLFESAESIFPKTAISAFGF